jgi:YgiT-type zinc finger domain-containing protein
MTIKAKRLSNTFCFECKTRITSLLPGGALVIVHKYPVYFCTSCVRRVLSAHVVDVQERERNIEQQASEQRNALDLATKLGYSHADLALQFAEREAIQSESREAELKAKKGR